MCLEKQGPIILIEHVCSRTKSCILLRVSMVVSVHSDLDFFPNNFIDQEKEDNDKNKSQHCQSTDTETHPQSHCQCKLFV